MSTTATPPNKNGIGSEGEPLDESADDSHALDSFDETGGSLDEGDNQEGGGTGDDAGGGDEGAGDQGEGSGRASGVGTESGDAGGGSGDAPDPQYVTRMEQENAQLREIVDQIHEQMQQDPELKRKLSGNGTNGGESSSYEQFERVLRDPETGFVPKSADALLRALGPILKDYDRLKEQVGEVSRGTRDLSRTVGSTLRERTLLDMGLSPEVIKSKQFRQIEADPRVRAIGDPTLRAEHAALRYLATQNRRASNRENGARIASAKVGRNGNQPARGASTAQRIIEITRGPDAVDRAEALRFQAVKRGQPLPTIKFIDKK